MVVLHIQLYLELEVVLVDLDIAEADLMELPMGEMGVQLVV
jgi:hypothetical protein